MKDKIAKAKKYVNMVDKVRVTLLCVALLMLVFIFLGEKLWGQQAWFTASGQYVFAIMFLTVFGSVVATVIKFALIAYHNSLVKKL